MSSGLVRVAASSASSRNVSARAVRAVAAVDRATSVQATRRGWAFMVVLLDATLPEKRSTLYDDIVLRPCPVA
jgi:hypothetical protein